MTAPRATRPCPACGKRALRPVAEGGNALRGLATGATIECSGWRLCAQRVELFLPGSVAAAAAKRAAVAAWDAAAGAMEAKGRGGRDA